jgi:hypothetical protein
MKEDASISFNTEETNQLLHLCKLCKVSCYVDLSFSSDIVICNAMELGNIINGRELYYGYIVLKETINGK